MIAVAVLAIAPGNHANTINSKTISSDNTSNPQMVLVEEDLQLLDGGSGPVVDGHHIP